MEERAYFKKLAQLQDAVIQAYRVQLEATNALLFFYRPDLDERKPGLKVVRGGKESEGE